MMHNKSEITAIHQFHSGSAFGDGVTNSMLFIQELLLEFGFESHIYVEKIAPELKDKLKHYKEYTQNPHTALFLHHSMGHDLDNFLSQLTGKNWLIYHNITPPTFLEDNPALRHYAEKGLTQLHTFKPNIEAAIAVSPFNAIDLKEANYTDVEVIPLLCDLAKIKNTPWNEQLTKEQSKIPTILFVGKICAHKQQLELVRMANVLQRMLNTAFQVVLVGSFVPHDPYVQKIRDEITALGLKNEVILTGKVSEPDLYAWYRAADVFVCASQHEGFCMPLIEAMALEVPVIALSGSNINNTMGESGLLLRENNPAAIATLVRILLDNRQFRKKIIAGQAKHIQSFSREILSQQLADFLIRQGIKIPNPIMTKETTKHNFHYHIQGTFETAYSLDLVNREIAHALKQIDNNTFLSEEAQPANVVIRNVYPPDVTDMQSPMNMLYFAWEESRIPPIWVEQFNRKLDAIPAPSHFVAKVLRDNGVHVPIHVIGEGADHIERIERTTYVGDLGDGFRFLHISSCFPRKGLDVLLEAYAMAFTNADPVTLIIKTITNAHHSISDQIVHIQKRYNNCPRIILIEKELSDGEIKDLYLRCDALVAPSRGEGFGLPMAEAMWLGKPVITTAYSGQIDFCNENTAWLVDYNFAYSNNHFNFTHSVWANPKIDSLVEKLRELYRSDNEARFAKTEAAKLLIKDQFLWKNCAYKLNVLENKIKKLPTLTKQKKLAWVSPWNTKCGIATYSSFLIDTLDPTFFDLTILASRSETLITDEMENVKRCWINGLVDDLVKCLEELSPDIIVIQYHLVFFPLKTLNEIIEKFYRRAVISITFHNTNEGALVNSFFQNQQGLRKATRLLVHTVDDLNRFKNHNLIENLTLIPHGVKNNLAIDKQAARNKRQLAGKDLIIASYGFLMPHKGIEELILAFPQIIAQHKNSRLLLINAICPNDASSEFQQHCQHLIKKSGYADRICMINDFLPDDESLLWLACADLCVFPYQQTEESASGAVRYALSSQRPVLCSPLPIFADLKDVVHFLPGTTPDAIASGILDLLKHPKKLDDIREKQLKWVNESAWESVGFQFFNMLKGLSYDKGDN